MAWMLRDLSTRLAISLAEGTPDYVHADAEVWNAFWKLVNAANATFSLPSTLLSALECCVLALVKFTFGIEKDCNVALLLIWLAALSAALNALQVLQSAAAVCGGNECCMGCASAVFQLVTSLLCIGAALLQMYVCIVALVVNPTSCWIAVFSFVTGAAALVDGGFNLVAWPIALWIYQHQAECPLPNVPRWAGATKHWLGIAEAIRVADNAHLDGPVDVQVEGEMEIRARVRCDALRS